MKKITLLVGMLFTTLLLAQTEVVTINNNGDTMVGPGNGGAGDRRNQHQNFGGFSKIKLGNWSYDEIFYGLIRFDISNIDHTKVVSAKLICDVSDEGRWNTFTTAGDVKINLVEMVDKVDGENTYGADSWIEGDRNSEWWDSASDLNYTWVTYAQGPDFGTVLNTLTIPQNTTVTSSDKHEYDITNKLKTEELDGVLSLGLQIDATVGTLDNRLYYKSKEGSTDGPYIEITVETPLSVDKITDTKNYLQITSEGINIIKKGTVQIVSVTGSVLNTIDVEANEFVEIAQEGIVIIRYTDGNKNIALKAIF